jgi:Ca2+-binding RTX toxin-like protein
MTTQIAPVINLSRLDGTIGFTMKGIDSGDLAGFSASDAGDVNGDGFADLIVSAYQADPGGRSNAGESYVVFGRGSFGASLELSALNGNNGFRLNGIAANDRSGFSVSGAGDVNGDGFDDLIIGSNQTDLIVGGEIGEAYIVFGRASFGASLGLGGLSGGNGVRLVGAGPEELTGFSVSGAGDINRDGFADVIVGALQADPDGRTNAGESYVVFGRGNLGATLDLGTLNGNNGFTVEGVAAGDQSGVSVSEVGDVNGDGRADFIVGANGADGSSGAAYVVFGRGSFNATLDLSALNGNNGFRMEGLAPLDTLGFSVSSAGDVNGDGIDDLIVGASRADLRGADNVGQAYLVYGRTNFGANVDLGRLNGTNGLTINGVSDGDEAGVSVSGAGDVNADGFADVVVGAFRADPGGERNAGSAYVVFGGGSLGATVELRQLDGDTGFRLDGIEVLDNAGRSVSGAGDLNGDGIDDLIVSGHQADPGGRSAAGESYAVFGALPEVAVTRIGTAVDQTIRGGAFADVLSGLGGRDRLFGNGGADRLNGGTGNDQLFGNAGNDTLLGGVGADVINGGSGTDTASYAGSGGGVVVNLASGAAGTGGDAAGDRLTGIENLVGSSRDDRLTGDDEVNRIESGAGDDVVALGAGADRAFTGSGDDEVDGGNGSDRIEAGSGNDTIDGGGGTDTILAGSGADRILGNRGADDITGASGRDVIVAGSGADTVSAGSGDDRVTGGSGGDEITGGSGDDVVTAGSGSDEVRTGSGDDRVQGNSGRDRIVTGSGDDRIQGGSDDDRIEAGSGRDRLNGDAGNDRLSGGGDADVFEFGRGGGRDVITDFADEVDRIALAGFGSDRGAVRDQARQDGGDVVFEFGGGDRLTVQDISLGALFDDVVLV